MVAAAAAVVITAFVVTMWLLAIASHAKPGTDRANARLDAVRTGLAAGAGAGAAVGLMLAFRRQHHQEIATDLSDSDATERRITELYTKAVEQLGNDKAPVRLGGLYALERLAQDNPAHRQTIVNVICAYLRMPFSPTAPTSKPEPEATEEDLGEPAAGTETRTVALGDTWQQERQVRLTAQRILAEHLRGDRAKDQHSTEPPSARFWPSISLDLAGATLIDLNLEGCVVADADFGGATFNGAAGFLGVTFNGAASFGGTTFTSDAWFGGATFSHTAVFDGATFTGGAEFNAVTFTGFARFGKATFTSAARVQRGDLQRRRRVPPGDLHRRRRVRCGDVHRRRLVRRGDLQRRRRVLRGDLHQRRRVQRGDLHRPRPVRQGDLHRRRGWHVFRAITRPVTRRSTCLAGGMVPRAGRQWRTHGCPRERRRSLLTGTGPRCAAGGGQDVYALDEGLAVLPQRPVAVSLGVA